MSQPSFSEEGHRFHFVGLDMVKKRTVAAFRRHFRSLGIPKTMISGLNASMFSKHFSFRKPRFNARLQPAFPIAVIGDIHGSLRQVETLLDLINRMDARPDRVVFVGDYIDRGDDSAGVLRLLQALDSEKEYTCLMGNHEQMMVDFLSNPAKHGSFWLNNGGLQTLASFGVSPIPLQSPEEAWLRLSEELSAALGPTLELWLRSLPQYWQCGNVAVVHAGADPALPLEDQSRSHLLWGHPDFTKRPREDGLWIVHGHTIVDTVQVSDGRFSIDTGCYATGRLSAVILETDQAAYFST